MSDLPKIAERLERYAFDNNGRYWLADVSNLDRHPPNDQLWVLVDFDEGAFSAKVFAERVCSEGGYRFLIFVISDMAEELVELIRRNAMIIGRDAPAVSFATIKRQYSALVRPGFEMLCDFWWATIVDRFLATVRDVLPADETFILTSVKQMYGSIEIRWQTSLPRDSEPELEIWQAYALAILQSARTCERCGKPGAVRRHSDGRVFVACDEHSEGVAASTPLTRVVLNGLVYRYDEIGTVEQVKGDGRESFRSLQERYPRLLPEGFPFGCHSGWVGILDRYFAEVEAILPPDIPFRIDQIKEKFGTLRIYCEPVWPDRQPTKNFEFAIPNMGARADAENDVEQKLKFARIRAEGRSAHTCEVCGRPGQLTVSGHWYRTACDEHAKDGKPVGGEDGVWNVGGTRWRFDVELDDIVESRETPMYGDISKAFKRQLDVVVQEQFDVTEYEVVGHVPVLWSGWQGDSLVAHVKLPDGRREIVFADSTGNLGGDPKSVLEERLSAYRTAIEETLAFLKGFEL